jgi:hypothetical protein
MTAPRRVLLDRGPWQRSCQRLPSSPLRVSRSFRFHPEVLHMDDRRFDALARSVATGQSRRRVLKGMLGLGGAAAVTAATLPDVALAARRGYGGPPRPGACVPSCDGTTCGANGCGGTCSCERGLECILGTDLCAWPCEGNDQCSDDCHCDPNLEVCASNQLGAVCSAIGDCPAGTFCGATGFDNTACVAPCIHP